MDFTNLKIKQIIEECNLTPSKFADEIMVQRAIISHILAGRNKPSLDIIVKINKWNPSYTLDYFKEDDSDESKKVSQMAYNEGIQPHINVNHKALELNKKNLLNNPQKNSTDKKTDEGIWGGDGSKQVERILIFYSDKTFSEYRPA